MLVVRILPAQRLEEYLGAVTILIGLLVAVGFQLPRLLGGERFGPQSGEALEQALVTAQQLPLPSMWAGESLIELAQNSQAVSALTGIGSYLLITVGLFAFTVLVSDRLYLSGWLRMQGSGVRRQGFKERAGLLGGSSLDASLAYKDWLLRLRNPRQLASLFSGIVFAFVLAFLLLRPQEGESLLTISQSNDIPAEIGWLTAALSPGVVASSVILFIGWSTFGQPAIASLALEQGSFYVLKTAPISPRQALRGKILGVVAPYAVLVTLLLATSWSVLRFSLGWTPYAWLCLLIIGYGLLTFATAVGFVYPRLDWEDPRRMTTGRARLTNLIGSVIYSLVAGLLALMPYVLALWLPSLSLLFVTVGLAVLLAVTWILVRASDRWVERVWWRLPDEAKK
jgi:ABC-2 type transport system permease protein